MRKTLKTALTAIIAGMMLLALVTSCAPKDGEKHAAIEITDQLGRVVLMDSLPERIISMSPGNTEIIYALGLEDHLVAVTDYCNYPPEAGEKASIGGFSTPNIEEIVALDPDLLLATSMHEKKVIPQLEEHGLTILALNPKTIDEVMQAITLIGQAAGVADRAVELVNNMQERISAVTDKTAGLTGEDRPGTFFVVWHDPLKTAGEGTLQDEFILLAGGSNIASGLSAYADMGLEAVIAANPQVIIVGTGHGSAEDATYQYALSEERLAETDARSNGSVYAMDADITNRPGPRIVDALERFAAFIHPELFE